jgi:hypothetical protein
MKFQLQKGATSNILTVFIMDDTATDGSGLAGLDQTSSITGGYVRMGAVGVALAVDENVTTEGTYEAPSTAGQVRIGTPANMVAGTYELHFHNDLFATGAESVTITLDGATNMAPLVLEVQLMTTEADRDSAIADQVWDEILTGGTHNISTSAGRRLRALAGGGVYENGSIWIDTVNGTAGTEDFENGTSSLPVNSLADAKTLATSLGIFRFTIVNGSSITLDADLSGYSFFGDNWTLALGGQTLDSIYVTGATVTGIMAGTGTTQVFHRCFMGACSLIAGTHLHECAITGTQTVVEAGDFFIDRCHSGIAGTSTWVFDFGAAIGNTNLNVRNYSGGIQLESMGDAGTDTASIEGQGQIIEGTCTGGTVAVRGAFTTSGITNLTMSEAARLDHGRIAEASGRLLAGTSTASSTTSTVFVQAGDTPSAGTDDDYNGCLLVVWSTSDKTGQVNVRQVDDYDDSGPSFAVSPALTFTPGSGDIVEIWQGLTAASLSSITGGFGATSPDRLIDHLRSIMSKGAVTPSSLGTYDPAADSQEAISENLALALGAGFSTSTDSLKEIRDAIDTLVAPAVVSASSLSGSGFLSDVVSLIRKATDEPGQSPKYTDGDIVELVQAGMDAVMTDIDINTDHPIVVRYSITLVDGTQYYVLPPNVSQLIRIAKINSSTGLPEYEVWPGSHMNPGGHGWKLEGNVLRLLRDWDSTDTLELMYYPNSEPAMHKATASAIDATTVTFPSSVTDGTLGLRPNEYVGMIIRILSSTQNYQEERLITAYDVTTKIATVAKAWDTTPTGTVVYEVVPIFSRTIKHVVALRAAIDLLSQEGNSQRMATLNQNYAIKLSAMRRQLSKMEGRFPHHFDGDTWDNTNRGGFYGA